MLESVGEAARAVLDAIVAGGRERPDDPRRVAWLSVNDPRAPAPARAELVALGLAVEWNGAVTLTPLAAERLGVDVREYGWDEHPAFADAHEPERHPVVRREHGRRDVPAWVLERVPDPAPSPLEELLMDEYTGEPVLLFGSVPVRIDRRIGSKRKPPRKRRAS